MITLLALYLLFYISKAESYDLTETDCIVMAILAHSIANEIAIFIKGR